MTIDTAALPVVDAMDLTPQHRALLRPGELMASRSGECHRLPRFFYVVESSAVAAETQLTPHFSLWEFLEVDLYEPALLRAYPRYIPCAISVLANALESLRAALPGPVKIAANGGYRSPSHIGSRSGSPHSWASAANIFRVGSEYLDTEERIVKYGEIARRTLADCWTRPYGHGLGQADDHLHLDLGYVTVVPRQYSEAGQR